MKDSKSSHFYSFPELGFVQAFIQAALCQQRFMGTAFNELTFADYQEAPTNSDTSLFCFVCHPFTPGH